MRFTNIICIVLLIFYACNSDDIDPIDNCETAAGPPKFVTDPVLLSDPENVELRVKADIPSNIYYIISETPLSDKSPSSVKAKAQSEKEFVRTGSFAISCNTLDTLTAISISGLPTDTQLYAYLIAENAQPGHELQEQATIFTFTTAAEPLAVKTFHSSVKGREALYVRYLPTENRPTSSDGTPSHPLIIFLGGNSEVAPQGEITVIQNGSVPEYISKGNHLPFVVIAPEHNTPTWNSDFVKEVVHHAIDYYNADPDRVIITGLSGGGNGTLNFAIKYPDIPAAIVPLSGWADDPDNICNLKNMAVWAFHNEADPKVLSKFTINLIDALKNCNPTKEVKRTIFKDEGHNSWIRVYNPKSTDWTLDPTVDPIDIYDWMYQQSK